WKFVNIAVGSDHNLALAAMGSPWISSHPKSCYARAGESALFHAEPTGAFPLACQWYHDDVAVPGATNHWLSLSNAQRADAGQYTLLATNTLGEVTSQPAMLTVNTEPFITSPASVRTVLAGTPHCFQVTVL